MRVDSQVISYISGESFSTGLPVKFILDDEDFHYQERITVLKEMCRAKKVLHIGCIDHNPQIVAEKIKKGKWLHSEINAVASLCKGVDINEEGIKYIKENLGIDNIYNCNIFFDEIPLALQEDWDIILIPEVIEHLNEPINFVRQVASRIKAKNIIITVPNAFTSANLKMAQAGVEVINTDHRFWFTPYTLVKNLYEAGLTTEKIIMCHNGRINKYKWLKNWQLSQKPLLRSAIVAVCHL